MKQMKFIQVFLFILIIIGIGLLATQKTWVPKLVNVILKFEASKEVKDLNLITYTDTQNGFEFNHPTNETIEVKSNWTYDKESVGKKIVYLQVEDSKSKHTCIAGIDVRCSTVTANGHTVVIQFQMDGGMVASTELPNKKVLFFSLSCDTLTEGMTGKIDYCSISKERVDMFENLLSTLNFI